MPLYRLRLGGVHLHNNSKLQLPNEWFNVHIYLKPIPLDISSFAFAQKKLNFFSPVHFKFAVSLAE